MDLLRSNITTIFGPVWKWCIYIYKYTIYIVYTQYITIYIYTSFIIYIMCISIYNTYTYGLSILVRKLVNFNVRKMLQGRWHTLLHKPDMAVPENVFNIVLYYPTMVKFPWDTLMTHPFIFRAFPGQRSGTWVFCCLPTTMKAITVSSGFIPQWKISSMKAII